MAVASFRNLVVVHSQTLTGMLVLLAASLADSKLGSWYIGLGGSSGGSGGVSDGSGGGGGW